MKIIISTTILITLLIPYNVSTVNAENREVEVVETQLVISPIIANVQRGDNRLKTGSIQKKKKPSSGKNKGNKENISLLKDISTQKSLKKEINRRKRLHKNLLSLYNKNFENKYLKLIKDNAMKLKYLKDSYHIS